MKKLIAIGIATVVLLGISLVSYADPMQTTKNASVEVDVDPIFGFTLWDPELIQDLGNIDPGGGAIGNLHMTASSNHDVVWRIQASSNGLSGSGAAIPVVISTVGTGTTVTDLTLAGTATDIYTAAASEYPATGVTLDGIFSVTAASDQEQGTYTGTIVLTMVE